MSRPPGAAYHPLLVQATVTAAVALLALVQWWSGGKEGQSWVLELFLAKGPRTMWVGGVAAALVLALALPFALLLLRGGALRRVLIPGLALVNAAPIALALKMLPRESLVAHPALGAILMLLLTNLLIYYHALHFFQELAAEVRKPYLENYRFHGASSLAVLREKILWLVVGAFKSVFFLTAGLTLFTDLHFAPRDPEAAGAIGSLFSILSRPAALSSRLFLLLITAVFFSALFLLYDALVLLPLERQLRGRANSGLIDRAWFHLVRGVARRQRPPETSRVDARWWIAVSSRLSLRRSRWLFGGTAVFLLLTSFSLLASLPTRRAELLIRAASEPSEFVEGSADTCRDRPAASVLAEVREEAMELGASLEDGAGCRGERSLLSSIGSCDKIFRRDAKEFLYAVQGFADQPLGGAAAFFARIGPLAVATALVGYVLAILAGYHQQRWVVWLPSAIEAFPFMLWLLLLDLLAGQTHFQVLWYGPHFLWYVGLGLITLPICYQQSLRLIRELTDRNIVYSEKMTAIPTWQIFVRLTRFRSMPLLVGQFAFICGFALLIDASMGLYRQFTSRITLPALVGNLWDKAWTASSFGHPLVQEAYRGTQWELMLIIAELIAALFLMQQALSSAEEVAV